MSPPVVDSLPWAALPWATLPPEAAGWLFAAWLFLFGGAIGSFLNVVIYRLPAGIGLVTPGSHCPACKKAIRWFDNVPIFGWLVLRGRCRDCRARISVRYPIVEAVTAGTFLLLGAVEVLQRGENLPLPPGELSGAGLWPLAPWSLVQLYGICAYHLLLLCTLLAAVLIEWDGHRTPIRLFAAALIGGLAAPLFWPYLHPVATCPALNGWLAGAADGATGLAAGLLLGWLASLMGMPQHKTGTIACSACVGLFLGWQAAGSLTFVAVLTQLTALGLGRLLPGLRRTAYTAWLATATLCWILGWRAMVATHPWMG